MGGQDKGLIELDGLPLWQHVRAQLPQSSYRKLWLSANRNLDAYRSSGHPVLTDQRGGFSGPLAGIEAGLLATDAEYLLVLPCDVPQLPAKLLPTLWQARGQAPVIRARHADGPQPLVCLVARQTLPLLQHALDHGERRVQYWQRQAGVAEIEFDAAFTNVNDAGALHGLSATPLASR
ncbi:molybdopterin-guanine dinucleotide biosynthesis protein A [Andreprevotia lacus DSM 23236]|uniref:Molybdopterin-guanine dinucleotide biosynthesis protein A n=2 Tax=Andreprevotia TaxID=397275 RepID=A0A1W1XGU6_9NEIS|nr:molybdopterin-guanine dinucleotide biosynthesis protein A [Andreprevotia lacus DSM 23236]